MKRSLRRLLGRMHARQAEVAAAAARVALKIFFPECQDGDELERYEGDIRQSGARITRSRINDSGVGVVEIVVDDRGAFLAAFARTNSFYSSSLSEPATTLPVALNVTFVGCEDTAELEGFTEDIRQSGARIIRIDSRINESRVSVVEIVVDDRDAFVAAFERTNSFFYSNLGAESLLGG